MRISRGTDFDDAPASELTLCHFSGSKSSSKQETKNTDARVVGGDGSTNFSAGAGIGSGSNSRTQITLTDQGAVKDSLALARAGVEAAHTTAREAQAASGGLLTGALKMAGEQSAQFADALEKTKNNDTRALVIVGVAVVGLAATQLFKRS